MYQMITLTHNGFRQITMKHILVGQQRGVFTKIDHFRESRVSMINEHKPTTTNACGVRVNDAKAQHG